VPRASAFFLLFLDFHIGRALLPEKLQPDGACMVYTAECKAYFASDDQGKFTYWSRLS
jgi:hypothetical protein